MRTDQAEFPISVNWTHERAKNSKKNTKDSSKKKKEKREKTKVKEG